MQKKLFDISSKVILFLKLYFQIFVLIKTVLKTTICYLYSSLSRPCYCFIIFRWHYIIIILKFERNTVLDIFYFAQQSDPHN